MTDEKGKTANIQGLSKLGASKGGKKRMESMTSEERSELASMAATKRWENVKKEEYEGLPTAKHKGTLVIGDLNIACAVLEDKRRVLAERHVIAALGGKRGGSHWLRRQKGNPLPVYASAGNLEPFISPSLRIALSQPVRYRSGGSVANGVEATLLPEICDVWLKARQAGVLLDSQQNIAQQAEIVMRGLAHVGIIALVDEATGYQEVRDRDELNKILSAFIAKELLPWAKRFPDEFYQEMFRLRDWSYRPMSPKRPRLVGKLTNEIVYEKLPPGVLDELRSRNPIIKDGRRRHAHHQFLTEDIGHPALEKHIAIVTALMRASSNWGSFKRLLDKAVPTPGVGTQVAMFEDETDG